MASTYQKLEQRLKEQRQRAAAEAYAAAEERRKKEEKQATSVSRVPSIGPGHQPVDSRGAIGLRPGVEAEAKADFDVSAGRSDVAASEDLDEVTNGIGALSSGGIRTPLAGSASAAPAKRIILSADSKRQAEPGSAARVTAETVQPAHFASSERGGREIHPSVGRELRGERSAPERRVPSWVGSQSSRHNEHNVFSRVDELHAKREAEREALKQKKLRQQQEVLEEQKRVQERQAQASQSSTEPADEGNTRNARDVSDAPSDFPEHNTVAAQPAMPLGFGPQAQMTSQGQFPLAPQQQGQSPYGYAPHQFQGGFQGGPGSAGHPGSQFQPWHGGQPGYPPMYPGYPMWPPMYPGQPGFYGPFPGMQGYGAFPPPPVHQQGPQQTQPAPNGLGGHPPQAVPPAPASAPPVAPGPHGHAVGTPPSAAPGVFFSPVGLAAGSATAPVSPPAGPPAAVGPAAESSSEEQFYSFGS